MKYLSQLLFVLVLVFSNGVFAHASLKSSVPANGQVIYDMPKYLVFEFSKAARLTKVELFGNNGEKMKLAFMLSPRASERFEIPLSKINYGTYTIKWTAMGGDAHKMKGELNFTYSDKKISSEHSSKDETSHKDHNH